MIKKVILATGLIGIPALQSANAMILPPNSLHLQPQMPESSNVTEEQFNQAIDKVVAAYSSVITDHDGTLYVERRWEDPTVNAYAVQYDDQWIVAMFGGLARRPEVTVDGFTMVMCHELGHHLGGYPFSSEWASDEGQSDYFAAIACAKQVWGSEKAENAAFRNEVPVEAKERCDEIWNSTDEQNLCYRTLMAVRSVSELMASAEEVQINWTTPDTREVSRTSHAHPNAQCRLDTYTSAALCPMDFGTDVIPGLNEGNSKAGEKVSAGYTCTAARSMTVGLRPRCWFMPLLRDGELADN